MSHFFSLAPEGVGTAHVESLYSYVERLALAHGATRRELMGHLQVWWKARTGRHLPKSYEARLNGYSRHTALVLEALEMATSRKDLRGGAILALRGICAGNSIGSIRHTRAWCPACFEEDRAAGRPAYDRLVWQLQTVRRCSIHKLVLANTCPVCGFIQANPHRTRELDTCSHCGQSLCSKAGSRVYEGRPFFGESQSEALVAHLARYPRSHLATNPVNRLVATLERRIQSGEALASLRDAQRFRERTSKPQFNTVVAAAVYFNADIVQLLESPETAASQLALDFSSPGLEHFPRPFLLRRNERRAWFREQLEAQLASKEPCPSLVEFCQLHDYSPLTARYFHSKLSDALTRKHQGCAERRKREARAGALLALKQGNWGHHAINRKWFIRDVARQAGAPESLVAELIGELGE
ncbi:MAG: hypothetical protein A2579_03440 [Lysobacterales bacterium RIFOXYD1_FULL_69_11]|nr:MAG: hypothetical protein A2190_09485 [Xanthomonadales bacterium RIFOXYA1_FULL_69_10]OHE86639.1 MAG: hypothetical protein A2579_03440 [Xanthomonadales bacterium RIFOXYD1_FULL_69_11]